MRTLPFEGGVGREEGGGEVSRLKGRTLLLV